MNWLVLQARCSNYFLPSIQPSSPIEDFISLLLHPHLAVNKSAGNPLRPFFKSVGSAFWELPPAGQKGVRPADARTNWDTKAGQCPDGIWDTEQCPFFFSSLALQCPCAVNRFVEKLPLLGQCRRHRASVIRQQWASPRYCCPATAPAPPPQCPAQPFESRAHYRGGS